MQPRSFQPAQQPPYLTLAARAQSIKDPSELEARLQRNPRDAAARSLLVTWYHMQAQPAKQYGHLLWLTERDPDVEVLRRPPV